MWSLNYIVTKLTLTRIGALTLASLRAEVVAAILAVIYFTRRQRIHPRASDVWKFVYLGFFGYVLNQGCFVIGLAHTTSEHSVVIIASAPIIVLLLATALRLERLTTAKVVGMALCFFGVVVLETEHGWPSRSPLLAGDLITLTAILGFSLYAVLGKKVAAAYDTVSMNAFNAFAAGLIFLPIALREGIHLRWRSVGWAGWAGLLYMAGLSAVAGYLLFYWLLQHMEASRVVVINYFQPVLVFLFSIPLLGERPTPRVIASAALVITGVYLAEHVFKERAKA